MTWESVPLGRLIAPAPPSRLGMGRQLPLLSMTMRDGLIDQSSKFKKRIAGEDLSGYRVVKRGQLVVGFPIDEAVLAFQWLHEAGIVSPAYGLWDVRDEGRVDRKYLERFLRSDRAISFYKAKLRGTTLRRRSLPRAVFEAMPVPVPPLPEQRRIAAILDEADALRSQASAAKALAADLMRAKGNAPVGQSIPLGCCVTISSGKSIVGSEDSDSSARVLKISAVTSGVFLEAESKPLPSGYEPPPAHLVHAGDLLVSRANTAELVGASAFVYDEPPRPVALPDKLWRLTVDQALADPAFLHFEISSAAFRAEVSRRATGSGGSMKNIGQSQFLSIPVCLPPLEWQRQFAIRGLEIRAVQLQLSARAQELDNLFASLQHSAFRGEL